MYKICNQCDIEKEIDEFNKWSRSKDGFRNYCRECQKEYQKSYRSKNKTLIKIKSIEYRTKNKDKICAYSSSDKRKLQKKKYYEKNKDKIKLKNKEYYHLNSEERKKSSKDYRESIKNTEKYKNSRREYNKKWRKENRHITSWRKLLRRALNYIGCVKEDRTIDILGYSPIQLKEHMETLFTTGMSWENYGEWHIDHIVPISKFSKETPINIINSLDNLQPLWAKDNLIKGNKI